MSSNPHKADDTIYEVAIVVRRVEDYANTDIASVVLTGHQPRLLVNAAAIAADTAIKAHPATGEPPTTGTPDPSQQILLCGCTEATAATTRAVSSDLTGDLDCTALAHRAGGQVHIESIATSRKQADGPNAHFVGVEFTQRRHHPRDHVSPEHMGRLFGSTSEGDTRWDRG